MLHRNMLGLQAQLMQLVGERVDLSGQGDPSSCAPRTSYIYSPYLLFLSLYKLSIML